jgi:hypothetical protein
MKKLAAVLLTMALMVMLIDSSGVSFAVETDQGGVSAFKFDIPQTGGSGFVIKDHQGGVSSFSVETPDSVSGSFVIEDGSGGPGSFVIEILDGSYGLERSYAQYWFMNH